MTASRIFLYELENAVPGHTLILQQQDLCHGCYTPDWEPPEQIESSHTAGMQAESCGILTGTEGWVKYKIIRNSDQAHRGLVYLYWDNPYFGVTLFRTALATLRWTANCDEDAPSEGSGFASDEDPPFGFHLSVENTGHNGAPTNIDELGDLYRVPLAPVFVVGTAGIWERMSVNLKLTLDEMPDLLPAPGQHTQSLDIHPRRSILEGEWASDHVDVKIRFWAGQYEVTLTDMTPGAALNLTTTCSFGVGGLAKVFASDTMMEHLVSNKHVGSSYVEISKANVALAGVSAVLRNTGVLASDGASFLGMSSSASITASALKKQVQEIGVSHSPYLDALAAAAAEHAKESEYTLWPAQGIAIQLYDEYEDGRFNGYKLLYQRVLDDGTVFVSEFLEYVPSLH